MMAPNMVPNEDSAQMTGLDYSSKALLGNSSLRLKGAFPLWSAFFPEPQTWLLMDCVHCSSLRGWTAAGPAMSSTELLSCSLPSVP